MGPCGTEVGTNSSYVGALFPPLQCFPGCLVARFAVKRGLARWEEGTESLEVLPNVRAGSLASGAAGL